jgi:hypothetical protein
LKALAHAQLLRQAVGDLIVRQEQVGMKPPEALSDTNSHHESP